VTRSEAAPAPAGSEPGSDGSRDGSSGVFSPEAIGVAVLIAAGVVLRFVTVSDLWLDEALSVNIAALPLDQLPDALRQDGHPPLYYALLHVWMDVFGDGDGAVRSLSGVLSVATLPLVWLAGRRLGGTALAWIATVFLAVLPYAIRYGSETRMYSLVMLLVLAGYLLVGDALRRPTVLRLVAIAVVGGALLLSHYWALWLLAATVIVLAGRAYRASRDGSTDERRAAVLTGGAVAASGLFFLPWLPVFFDQMSSTGTPWASPVRPTTMLAVTMGDLGGGGGPQLRDAEVLGAAVLVLVLLGVFGRALDARRIELDLTTNPQTRAETAVIVLTAGIGIAASWVGSTAYASRYAAVVVPLIVLVAAAGATRFTGRVVRAVAVGGFAVFALGLAAYVSTVNRTQTGEIAAAIEADGQAGDLVVVCPDQLGPATERLLPDDIEVVAYPELGPAERVDWRDYEARHAVDPVAVADEVLARAGDRTIWLVSSPTYRVVDEQCDVLRDRLAQSRPAEVPISEDGIEFFEHASLTRFAPT
jgi:hypothetical protein